MKLSVVKWDSWKGVNHKRKKMLSKEDFSSLGEEENEVMEVPNGVSMSIIESSTEINAPKQDDFDNISGIETMSLVNSEDEDYSQLDFSQEIKK